MTVLSEPTSVAKSAQYGSGRSEEAVGRWLEIGPHRDHWHGMHWHGISDNLLPLENGSVVDSVRSIPDPYAKDSYDA